MKINVNMHIVSGGDYCSRPPRNGTTFFSPRLSKSEAICTWGTGRSALVCDQLIVCENHILNICAYIGVGTGCSRNCHAVARHSLLSPAQCSGTTPSSSSRLSKKREACAARRLLVSAVECIKH